MTRKKQPINTTDSPDIELLNSFLGGNDEAFSVIYRRYVDELFAYGVGLGFDRDTLKDVIQDVFYKLYENRKKLKNIKQLRAYLYSMLRNRLFDIYRASAETNDISRYEMCFFTKSTVLDEMIGEEEKLAVQAHIDTLMRRLTNRQREAVYLRFVEEMEYEEIAGLLQMTAPAVRKLISRSIKRMRE